MYMRAYRAFQNLVVITSRILVAVIIFSCFFSSIHAATYYVKVNGDDSKDGRSWSNAYKTLQKALATATSGDEIWVAKGTYYPDQGPGVTRGDRNASFNLKDGVKVYGGFAGTETTSYLRNSRTNLTTLSGNIGARDESEDNSVIIIAIDSRRGEDEPSVSMESTLLDGFTISGAFSNKYTTNWSEYKAKYQQDYKMRYYAGSDYGPVYIVESSPTISNCKLDGNWSDNYGGGIVIINSSPNITNCTFSNNGAQERGGAIYTRHSSGTIISGCTFEKNNAKRGGAIFEDNSASQISGCAFKDNFINQAYGDGAAIYYSVGTPRYVFDQETVKEASLISNCVFSGHYHGTAHTRVLPDRGVISAHNGVRDTPFKIYGSAFINNALNSIDVTGGPFEIFNCTFSARDLKGNVKYIRSKQGNGKNIAIKNSIIWDTYGAFDRKNSKYPARDFIVGDNINVSHSIIKGGYEGGENIITDNPNFVDLLNGDLHLKDCSPAKDAGVQIAGITIDYDGDSRPANNAFDIGYDENTSTGDQELYTYYADKDFDGYGDPASSKEACIMPSGYVENNTDCDDTDRRVHTAQNWYRDSDEDGFGDPNVSQESCSPMDGYVIDNTDCNDSDKAITTGTIWYNDKDQDGFGDLHDYTISCAQPEGYTSNSSDCNDNRDDIRPDTRWYRDSDQDGYGDPNESRVSCFGILGFVKDNTDCNDDDPDVNPGKIWYVDADGDGYGKIDATDTRTGCEKPDGYADNKEDCDDTNEDLNIRFKWYKDFDEDGYGNPAGMLYQCLQPEGYVSNDYDCNDAVAGINPRTIWYLDGDQDGIGDQSISVRGCERPSNDYVLKAGDCNDDDPNVQKTKIWYVDADKDGYGDPSRGYGDCYQPENLVDNNLDCDDTDPDVHPGSQEICNGRDDDCDRQVDEGESCCPPEGIIYVKANAVGANNGLNWDDAFIDLQDALSYVQESRCNGTQIWVANGIYKPTKGTNRKASFVMLPGIKMYGGFNGDETSINDRFIWYGKHIATTTVLSGDIGHFDDHSDNSYHVIYNDNNGLDESSLLDGFIIEGGHADEVTNPKHKVGGGIYNNNVSPTITNCIFIGNSASDDGGAIYNNNSNALITNCEIQANEAPNAAGISFTNQSDGQLINCTLSGNDGTAVKVAGSKPEIINTIIWGNRNTIEEDYPGATITNSILETPAPYKGNLKDNPQIDQPAIGLSTLRNSLAISPCSPAVDAGTANDNISSDIQGVSRPRNDNIDIGCYEVTKESGSDCPIFVHLEFSEITCTTDGSIKVTARASGGSGNYTYKWFEWSTGSARTMQGQNSYFLRGINVGRYMVRVTDADYNSVTKEFDIPEPLPTIIYVNKSAGSGGNGESWANAFNDLQPALSHVRSQTCPAMYEIWVAKGTYYPTTSTDREISFKMIPGVVMRGGFAGTETIADERDWEKNETILSGNIGTSGDGNDNSYHVIKNYIEPAPGMQRIDKRTVLDGFIIRDGRADKMGEAIGGGMYNMYCSPTITNCTFKNNYAGFEGGGMHYMGGEAWVNNCNFINNTSDGNGGGVSHDGVKTAEYRYCSFTENKANCSIPAKSGGNGGGLYFRACESVLIEYCFIKGNSAIYQHSPRAGNVNGTGGGLCALESVDIFLRSSVISGNLSQTSGGDDQSKGGGIYTDDNTPSEVYQCTVVGNKSGTFGGFRLGNYNPHVGGSIIWGNSPSEYYFESGVVVESIIEGFTTNLPGFSSIDPMFVEAPDWNQAPTTAGDLHLLPGCSPAKKGIKGMAYAPQVFPDIEGTTSPYDGRRDLGAYQSTDPLTFTIYYQDRDYDGFGNYSYSVASCFPEPPAGYSITSGDCDDSNSMYYPGRIWYRDSDQDGYGTGEPIEWCDPPNSYEYATRDGDCDDDDREVTNKIQTWYYDMDRDGYPGGTQESCARPDEYALSKEQIRYPNLEDCDDDNSKINPGRDDICNGIDDNCDGVNDPICSTVMYVNASVSGGNGVGDSWANAISDLQTAISKARGDEFPELQEIWVAKGTYYPDNSDIHRRFSLVKNIVIRGGFMGTESALAQRRLGSRSATILDGKIPAEQYPINTIIRNEEDSHSGTLDGFTIRNARTALVENENCAPTFTNCKFENNTRIFATMPGDWKPIGIDNNYSIITVENCNFYNLNGAGIRNKSSAGATINIKNSTFSDNNIGLENFSGNAIVDGCTFEENTEDGLVNFAWNIEIKNSTFLKNKRGILMENVQNATISDCSFTDNENEDYGGGIYSVSSEFNLIGCTFTSNHADKGGGLCLQQSDITIDGCKFEGNGANYYGGGIYMDHYNIDSDDVVSINDSKFNNNSADLDGGGIYNSSATLKCNTTWFWGNSAKKGAGIHMRLQHGHTTSNQLLFIGNSGFIYNASTIGSGVNVEGGHFQIANCTFTKNNGQGTVVSAYTNNGYIINTIVWGNYWYNMQNNVTTSILPMNSLDVSYSIVEIEDAEQTFTGTSNLNQDPILSNNFYLKSNSPAINSGKTLSYIGNEDISGNNRLNGQIDIGASESE
jgi:predicted outer membrane repeat protein